MAYHNEDTQHQKLFGLQVVEVSTIIQGYLADYPRVDHFCGEHSHPSPTVCQELAPLPSCAQKLNYHHSVEPFCTHPWLCKITLVSYGGYHSFQNNLADKHHNIFLGHLSVGFHSMEYCDNKQNFAHTLYKQLYNYISLSLMPLLPFLFPPITLLYHKVAYKNSLKAKMETLLYKRSRITNEDKI